MYKAMFIGFTSIKKKAVTEVLNDTAENERDLVLVRTKSASIRLK